VNRIDELLSSMTGDEKRRLQVVAGCAGKAIQRVVIKLGGINCDACQVDKDAPEIAALREPGVNRCDITVRVKYVLGHRLKVIDKRQVNLGVSEVRCGIGYHGAVVGGDEVVLLSVAVKQCRLRLWTAEQWQPVNETLHVTSKFFRQVPRVNGGPEHWNNTPFAIEAGPVVGGDGLVVLRQGTEETIEILEPEPSAMHLMQGGQGVTDSSPVVGCPVLRRTFG